MPLEKETGTASSTSQTYVQTSDYILWADTRFGTTRPTRPVLITDYEAIILRAMDALDQNCFKGRKVDSNQALQWPRTGVRIDTYAVESDEIPQELINAQYEYIYAEELGNSELLAVERKVESKRVGPITVKYSNNSSSTTINRAISRALRKLIKAGSSLGGSNFVVNRS